MRKNELPHDFFSEQALIGSLILNNRVFDEISEIRLTADDFYDKRLGLIFNIITELQKNNTPVDYITVNSKLKTTHQLEKIGGENFILSIVNEHITDANAYGYAVVIKEQSTLRNIINTSQQIAQTGYTFEGNIKDFISEVESKYFKITTQYSINKTASIFNLIKENLRDLEDNSRLPGEINGLSTGFPELDKILLGIQSGRLYIIGARPGMGKSALALNLAYNACKQSNLPVIFFSLEMTGKELSLRLLSSVAKIDNKRLKTKNFLDSDLRNLAKATAEVSKLPFYIDETSSISLMEINSICRKKKSEEGLGMVVIDYLQLMGVNKSVPREQQISEISRGLKALARDLDCPVITLSQLNRESESGVASKGLNRRPTSSNLRESGAIEQDADAILLIYRDDYYNKDTKEPGVAEIIVTKNRSGEQGTAKLNWIGAYTSFENLKGN